MEKLQFKTIINAPAAKVYHTMLGLSDKATYEAWTSEFNPTSTYEGNWEKGSKILFIGTDENGVKGGMVSEIAENIPNKFVSIRSYGLLKDGVEITEGPEVEQWAGGFENYSFEDIQYNNYIVISLPHAKRTSNIWNPCSYRSGSGR